LQNIYVTGPQVLTAADYDHSPSSQVIAQMPSCISIYATYWQLSSGTLNVTGRRKLSSIIQNEETCCIK